MGCRKTDKWSLLPSRPPRGLGRLILIIRRAPRDPLPPKLTRMRIIRRLLGISHLRKRLGAPPFRLDLGTFRTPLVMTHTTLLPLVTAIVRAPPPPPGGGDSSGSEGKHGDKRNAQELEFNSLGSIDLLFTHPPVKEEEKEDYLNKFKGPLVTLGMDESVMGKLTLEMYPDLPGKSSTGDFAPRTIVKIRGGQELLDKLVDEGLHQVQMGNVSCVVRVTQDIRKKPKSVEVQDEEPQG